MRYWRDLLLWNLLAREPPTLDRLRFLMEESFPRSMRKLLFGEYDRDRVGRYAHYEIDRKQLLALRDRRSLDAFTALLCVAREGELIDEDHRHSVPTLCAFDVLPYVLHRHAQLRRCWHDLYACLERVFFLRTYGESGFYFSFLHERVEAGLLALDADPNATLDPMSGERETDSNQAGTPAQD